MSTQNLNQFESGSPIQLIPIPAGSTKQIEFRSPTGVNPKYDVVAYAIVVDPMTGQFGCMTTTLMPVVDTPQGWNLADDYAFVVESGDFPIDTPGPLAQHTYPWNFAFGPYGALPHVAWRFTPSGDQS